MKSSHDLLATLHDIMGTGVVRYGALITRPQVYQPMLVFLTLDLGEILATLLKVLALIGVVVFYVSAVVLLVARALGDMDRWGRPRRR